MNRHKTNGYILIYRDLINKAVDKGEKFSPTLAKIDFISMASHCDKVVVRNNTNVRLSRGELSFTTSYLVRRWGWTIGQIRHFLATNGIASPTTSKTTNKQQTYAIDNYDTYQLLTTSKQQAQQQAQQQMKQQQYNTLNNNTLNTNKKGKQIFQTPSLRDIENYVLEKKYIDFDSEIFYNYYESNGWYVGKNKMRKWKSAVSGWHSRNKKDMKNERNNKSSEKGIDLWTQHHNNK